MQKKIRVLTKLFLVILLVTNGLTYYFTKEEYSLREVEINTICKYKKQSALIPFNCICKKARE